MDLQKDDFKLKEEDKVKSIRKDDVNITAKQLGVKKGDKFVVLYRNESFNGEEHCSSLSVGDILTLTGGDGSSCPEFVNQDGVCAYESFACLAKYEEKEMSDYEKAETKAPVLWNAYKDVLNKEALDALAQVILDFSVDVFGGESNLEYAFKWRNTKQGREFWEDVNSGLYNKPKEEAYISETSGVDLGTLLREKLGHTDYQQSVQADTGYIQEDKKNESAFSHQEAGNHYQLPIQPITFILENNIPFCEANVIKYVVRHKQKNGKQDLLKAKHYIEMLIEHEYGNDV